MREDLRVMVKNRRDCCVCDCLIHPYHTDCSVDTCNCTLYPITTFLPSDDEDINMEEKSKAHEH
jgi:hypothetical protein